MIKTPRTSDSYPELLDTLAEFVKIGGCSSINIANSEEKSENNKKFSLPYLWLVLSVSAWIGIDVINADGSFVTSLMLILLLTFRSPIIGVVIYVLEENRTDNAFAAKNLGWITAIGMAVLCVVLLKSDLLEPAIKGAAEFRQEESDQQKSEYLKRLEGAAGEYYDRNCAKSSYGC